MITLTDCNIESLFWFLYFNYGRGPTFCNLQVARAKIELLILFREVSEAFKLSFKFNVIKGISIKIALHLCSFYQINPLLFIFVVIGLG